MLLDKMREQLLSYYDEVTHLDAPHIFDALNELAAHPKAGTAARFDKVYVQKQGSAGHPMLGYLAGCIVHKGENVLVLGRGILADFGVSSPKDPVTRELKAILAHEMGHAFHGDLRGGGIKTWSNVSPLIGMVGGLAGAHMVKKIIEKHPGDKEQQKAELEQSQELLKGANNGSLGEVAKIALYTAGVGLGLAAGIFGARALNHKMEFRADRFAKTLMGEGSSLASALSTLSRSMMRIKNVNVPPNAVDSEVVEAVDRIRGVLEKYSHPPMAQRIDALVR